MDIFSDAEPDLLGLELVMDFDNLTRKFYNSFEEDLDDWSESSEIYVEIKREVVHFESSYPSVRPTKVKRSKRKVEPVTVSTGRRIDNPIGSRIEKVEQDSPENIVVSDKNIKMVLRLPVNNRKENIKVVAHDDNSVSISGVKFSIAAANNHYAGFAPGTVNIFRQLLGLKEVKWGDEFIATDNLERDDDEDTDRRVKTKQTSLIDFWK